MKYLNIAEVLSIPRYSSPAVSPAGSKVAWVESMAHWDRNEYRKQVIVYHVETREALPLTAGATESFAPAWSFDGRLAWLSPVGEGDERSNQIFVQDFGQPIQVTFCKGGVCSFAWGPRNDRLFYIAPSPENEEMLRLRSKRYGDFEYVDVDPSWNCLFSIGLNKALERSRRVHWAPADQREGTGERGLSCLLAGSRERHIMHFDVSPDGNQVVFAAAPDANPEVNDRLQLYLLEIDSGKVTEVGLESPLDDYGQKVLFSPDGKRIAYIRPINEGRWGNICTLETLDLESGKTSQPLFHLDEFIYPKAWCAKGLVFGWQQKTDWYVGMLTENEKIVPLRANPGTVTKEIAISPDGCHCATITASREQCFEVMLGNGMLTNNRQHYRDKILSEKKVITWKSHDGTKIEGVLIAPRETAKDDEPRPLLILAHGGPTEAALVIPSDDQFYPLEQFVERGFLILDVNFRGSSGYGDAFRNLNYRNLGLGDYEDVISGVDFLVTQGLADKDRVGVMGWSWGGYIAAMCATISDRFKAASVGAGISNWYTYYNDTDIHQFTIHYLGETPWNDPEIYAKTSPMTYIKNARTPTLIQHGDKDGRVPTGNAMELYQGLRDMGVEARLVLFKGAGHCPNRPGLHEAIMKQNYHWFCHHLFGDNLDEFWLPIKRRISDYE